MSVTAWSEQQQAFASALLDTDAPVPDFLRVRANVPVAERFDVYRNNVHSALIDALLAAFPVTAQLVSEDSLRALAREFLRGHLPRHAALHDYGAALPHFIRSYAPAAELPWLADVAALEHAWWQSYGAADATSIRPPDLAALPAGDLSARCARMHPATRLLSSAHPVHDIWTAHQSSGEPRAPQQWIAQCVLITRPEADVQVRHITPAQHAFLAALVDDATLEEAAATALARDAHFDFGITLLLAIEAGAIQELYP
jgi:hypothetical protein